jgi:hypothetical protein
MDRLLIALLLMVALTLPGCSFDDTWVLWSRYNGPGGNFWKILSEHEHNIWKHTFPRNREFCERALADPPAS